MGRKSYLLYFLLLLSTSAVADVTDNLSYLVSNYGIAYLWPYYYFDINSAAIALRGSMRAAWKVKGWIGLGSFEDLQNEYLYPPDGAVPTAVLSKLREFNTQTVATAEVPEFVAEHPLRRDVDLGSFEKDFIINRLSHAAPFFQKADENHPFIDPDTNLTKNPTPYGYALDTPLVEGADVPRIATCFSGGGFRAMIATLGFWQAVSDMGIAGSILYTANLSGSTWCTIPWSLGASLRDLYATYEKYAHISVGVATLNDLRKYVVPPMNANGALGYIRKKFVSAFLWAQPLSSVRGLYSPLLGQMTLSAWDDELLRQAYGVTLPKQSSQYLYFWQAMDFIKDGTTRPFPIATSLIPYAGNFNATASKIAVQQKSSNGIWMEFNPESVGFEYFDKKKNLTGVWIPSFALGRFFNPVYKEPSRWYRLFTNKTVLGYASEPAPVHTLDYWEGTWGSAFTVSPADVYRIFFKEVPPSEDQSSTGLSSSTSLTERVIGLLGSAVGGATTLGKEAVALSNMSDVRLFPAYFNNFAPFDDSPIKASTFSAVDAGIDFNLPFPPLLRQSRGIDLIIVGDWTEATPKYPAKQLCLAEEWAKTREVPFPKIRTSTSYKTIYDRPMTLFNEYAEGQQGPAILYIPLIDNEFNVPDFNLTNCFNGSCSTFNFDYTKKGRNGVKDLSEEVYNILWDLYPQIRQVVQQLVIAKNDAVQNEEPYRFSMTMDEVDPIVPLTTTASAAA